MPIHDFQDSMARERDDTLAPELRATLKRLFPEASGWRIAKPGSGVQRKGIDCEIITRRGLISIDFKFRETVYPDFALEFEHRHDDGRMTLGWVADVSKACDLFAYVFKPTWTCWLLPRRALQAAWIREGWLATYGEGVKARNRTYVSVNCPVPIDVACREVGGIRWGDNDKTESFERDPREHYCSIGCGDWGAFGVGQNWYCRKHRAVDAPPIPALVLPR